MDANPSHRGLFDLFHSFAKARSHAKKARAVKLRSLLVESLEDRQLLSASPYETGIDNGVVVEQICAVPQNVSSVQDPAWPLNTTAWWPNQWLVDGILDQKLTEAGQDPDNLSAGFVFNLNNNPGSDYTIFLDFDGNSYSGNYWKQTRDENGNVVSITHPVVTPPYDRDDNPSSFNNDELRNIYEIWLRVSEDYAPFNVNVTTKDPGTAALVKTNATDNVFGVRVAIGGKYSDYFYTPAGGVALLGSFSYNEDCPCFVFAEEGVRDNKNIASAISHEVGHTLGLSHDGDTNQADPEYANGANGWQPIMGTGYNEPLTQWSKGEYVGANQTEDDLAIIAGVVGYRADDHSNSRFGATSLVFGASETLATGIIEQNTDVDFFTFTTSGSVDLTVGGLGEGITNLDVLLNLYDAGGALLQTFDPTDTLNAVATIPGAGTYYLSVEGTGLVEGGDVIYTDYGSLGAYYITAAPPPEHLDGEPNESMETANDLGIISGTRSFAANINHSGDQDYYLFTIDGETNEDHYVRLTRQSVSYTYMELCDEKGRVWWYSETLPSGAKIISLSGKPSGDYYLRVYNYSNSEGTYSFEISAPETNAIQRPSLSVQVSGTTANLTIGAIEGASKYVVQYGLDPDFNNFDQKTFDAAVTYSISNLTRNENYYFRVKAQADGGGESRWRTTSALIAARDRFESNDQFETARDLGTLSKKRTYNLNLDSPSDEDWIRFTIPANGGDENYVRLSYDPAVIGGRIQFDLYKDYNGQGYWQVFSSEEVESGLETAKLANLSAGTYYLRVYNDSDNASGGFYFLEISPPTALAANALDRPLINYLYSFSSSYPLGAGVWISLNQVANAQEYVLQYGTDPDFGSYSTISYMTAGEHKIKDLTPETEYYFRVKAIANDYLDSGWSFGRATISAYVPDDPSLFDVYEPNDNRDELYDFGTLFEQNRFEATFHNNYDNDYYGFSLAAQGTSSSYVQVNFDPSSYCYFALYDAGGQYLKSATLTSEGVKTISLDGLDAGNYYFFVDSLYVGDYELVINAPSPANVLKRPIVSIPIRTASSITLDVASVANAQKYVIQYGTDETFDSYSNITLSEPGTRTIANLEANTRYYFRVKATATGYSDSAWTTFTARTGDAFELNDDRESAWDLGTLSGESTRQASLHNATDVDWYKFELAAKGDANSYIALNYANYGGLNVDAKLYDSFDALVGLSTDETGVEKISLNGKSAGTYYLRVYNGGTSNSEADYELFVSAPAPASRRLSAPVVTASTTKNAAVLKITAVANASKYVVHYSEDPTFSTYSEKIYLNAGSKTISGLASGTTHYFRAMAIADGYEDSEWTVFDAATKAEPLVEPTVAATGKLGRLEVEIGKVANATGYVLEIDENPDFSNARRELYSEPGTKTLDGLEIGTTYFLRVKATSERCLDSTWATASASTLDYNAGDVAALAALNFENWTPFAAEFNDEGRLISLEFLSSPFPYEYEVVDLSACDALERLYFYNVFCESVNLSGCANLTYLHCNSFKLSSLDLSGLVNLKEIECCWNRNLTDINLAGCSSLEYVDCYENEVLARLNLSGCSNLKELYCESNALSSLDLSDCENLEVLFCYHNALSSLDLSDCEDLTALDCSYNELTELDLSELANLTGLDCSNNKLTELDLSENPNLGELHFQSSGVESIDLSSNLLLTRLKFDDECETINLSAVNRADITVLWTEPFVFDSSGREVGSIDGLTPWTIPATAVDVYTIMNLEEEEEVITTIYLNGEPNDAMETATDLGAIVGTRNVNGELATGSDVDYYKFSITSPGDNDYLKVTYVQSGSFDVDITVYNSEGSYVAGRSGTTGVENVSLKDWADGEYFVKIYNYRSSSGVGGNYSLEIYANETNALSSPNLAVQVASPEVAVEIGAVEDASAYVLQYGTDREFNEFTQETRAEAGTWTLTGLTPNAPYFFRVKSISDDGRESRWTSVDRLIANPDPFETNDSMPRARDLGTLTEAVSYHLNLDSSRDVDWFAFTTVANGGPEGSIRLVCDGAPENADLVFDLYGEYERWYNDYYEYDEEGGEYYYPGYYATETYEFKSDVKTISFENLPAGNYYLRVYNRDRVGLPYSLEIVPPSPLVENELDRPCLETDDSFYSHYWYFNYFDATYDSMDISWSIVPNAVNYVLEYGTDPTFATSTTIVYSALVGETHYEEYDDYGAIYDFAYRHRVKNLTPSTTYYFRVKATAPGYLDSLWTGVGTLTTDAIPDDPSPYDAYEPNDSFSSAYDLETIAGVANLPQLSLHSNSDRDWYKFSIGATGTSSSYVKLLYSHNEDIGIDIDVKLYDSGYNLLKSSTKMTGEENISLEGLAPGDYYLYVYNYLSASEPPVPYSLTISAPSNVLKRPSVSIPTQTASSITLDVASVENAQKYVVQYGTDPTFDSYSNVSFSASGAQTIANLDVNTRYYFRVKATATGYSDSNWTTFDAVTIDAYESNDTLESAFDLGELAGESTYTANISSSADKDYYKFTILDEGKIDSYVAVSSGSLDAYLYNSTGALISLSTDDRREERVPLYGIPAGTYYLFVEYDADASSNFNPRGVLYDLTINAPIPTPKLETPTFASTASTSTSITLNIGIVQGAESYVVEYSRNNKFQSSTVLTRSEPGTMTISGLTIGATYYFRIKAVAEECYDSEWTSISAKTQPSAGPRLATPVIGLSGTKTAIVVKIDAVEDAQKYVVQYSTDSTFATYSEKIYASAGTKTISGLPTQTGYYVRVKAIATGHDDSVYATGRVYTSTDKCAVPTLKFSATKTAIVVNIGAVDKAEEYVVEYSVNSDFSNSTTRIFSGAGAKTISGLTFGTPYYVRVKARSSIANDSGWNDNNGKPIAAGQLAVPTFFASKVGSDFINVRCYNSAGASGFEVMWSTSSDFSDAQYAQAPASSGIVSLTGLNPNTKYYYKVRALGDNVSRVDSSWSVIVGNATTKAATPLPAPVAPSVSPTKTAVVIKLVAVENATNYVLEYGTDPTFATVATKNYSTVGAKTISGLSSGTTYYFRLKATAVGYSDSEWTTFEALTLGGSQAPTSSALLDDDSPFENYFEQDDLDAFWDVLAESLTK
ncbi:MAG: hypothetical protein IJM30_03225 [Thermoguttaceae bacterium]|nr:hypothetical protein [Thermoguttaceae bacterium]